jgi:glycosyltransferase involved in cell wall biosynthesis
MRVAVIHYWLTAMRGGERVLERILRLYPQADLFTHVADRSALSPGLAARAIRTSFISRLPAATQLYPAYLPLMPRALEALDLSAYDLVISSEAGPAKGVIPAPDAAHLCYCHSPMRYLWDQAETYRRGAGPLAWALPLFAHGLRQWDVTAAARTDRFVANSAFVARRIQRYWRRESTVVHPPVDAAPFARASAAKPMASEGFLWVGQLVPYKRADLAIAAFNHMRLPLTVVGRGPERRRLKALAGDRIRFLDPLPIDELAELCARSTALILTAKEDFGMVPVEVMAAGRPVLAYAGGGALETVEDARTGLFFHEQTVEALIDGVERLLRWLPDFAPAAAQARARRFSPEAFDEGFRRAVDDTLAHKG